MKIEDIIFDNDDKNLFLIDDLQLKADAIRYSILPKLEIINNEVISRISEMYDFDFFQNCTVGKSPQFRTSKGQRTKPVKYDYKRAAIWLYGQRTKNKWKGLKRSDNSEAQITATILGMELCELGLNNFLFYGYVKNFSVETHRKFYDYIDKELMNILSLTNRANVKFHREFENIISIHNNLKAKFEHKHYEVLFCSRPYEFPIAYEQINEIIYSNVMLFPILNAFLNLSLGVEPNIGNDIDKLEKNLANYYLKYFSQNDKPSKQNELTDLETVKAIAANKIKVQAGIRWQVFKRDHWQCVSCGRSADDNIILHIDHIIPRSKGGKNEMDNYQTLCETCNVGKSNSDDTDLRRK
ncbi:MAG: hypothetical protein RL660_887 [Bacteroidota bacterium]|jgi:5-methylcytosine-specific restriction endonuclease McrA